MSKQDVSGDNSKAMMAGRDATDNSINYYNTAKQDLLDYEVISEIFKHLFNSELPSKSIEKSDKLTHLNEKIALNFFDEGAKDVKKMFKDLWAKKSQVEEYIKNEDYDEDSLGGLILKFQECFREIKMTNTFEVEVKDINNFSKLASHCIPDNKKKDSRYLPNALAIVLYFFEQCDFGKKTKEEKLKSKIDF